MMAEFKRIAREKYLSDAMPQATMKAKRGKSSSAYLPNSVDKTDKTLEPPSSVSFVNSFPKENGAGNDLIETLPNTLARLPWQLERLVHAASSNVLELELRGVPDPNRYVLGWAAVYLTGDQEAALSRLWQVRYAWQSKPPS